MSETRSFDMDTQFDAVTCEAATSQVTTRQHLLGARFITTWRVGTSVAEYEIGTYFILQWCSNTSMSFSGVKCGCCNVTPKLTTPLHTMSLELVADHPDTIRALQYMGYLPGGIDFGGTYSTTVGRQHPTFSVERKAMGRNKIGVGLRYYKRILPQIDSYLDGFAQEGTWAKVEPQKCNGLFCVTGAYPKFMLCQHAFPDLMVKTLRSGRVTCEHHKGARIRGIDSKLVRRGQIPAEKDIRRSGSIGGESCRLT